MEYNKGLINFIELNKELINNNEFEELYEEAARFKLPITQLTSLLTSAGIDVIKYLENIPSDFFCCSKEQYGNIDEYNSIIRGIINSLKVNNIKNIKSYSFNYIDVDKDLILDNVNIIGRYAFFKASFNNIFLDKGNNIESNAFMAISGSDVKIRDFCNLQIFSFANSHLNNLWIDRVDFIRTQAFIESKVETIHLTNIKEVATASFKDCSDVESIYIHEGVENIKISAFTNCNKSLNIYCADSEKPKSWDEGWDKIYPTIEERYNVIWGYKGL